MACTCATGCTLVTISGISYCDCPVIQDQVCPTGYVLTNLGGGNMVCRQIDIIDSTPCASITTKASDGYEYNSITAKSEKTVLIEPCPPGYQFVPTNDGFGKCIPPAGPGTLLCPSGYTYNAVDKTCVKVTSTSATANSVTRCNADIVFLRGKNPDSVLSESLFVNAFIDSIATDLNSVSNQYRIGIADCSENNTGNQQYLYSGIFTAFTHPAVGYPNTSSLIKAQFPTSVSNDANLISNGLNNALSMLQTSPTVTNTIQKPTRSDARKIIVLFTEYGPTSSGAYNVNYGSCIGDDPIDHTGNYGTATYTWKTEMIKTINHAKCLLAANPNLEIFVVWSGTEINSTLWGGKLGQFFFDLKSVGIVYPINSSTALPLALRFKSDLLALQSKTGAPAVCNTTTTYICPLGETLSGSTCKNIDVIPALSCDSSCSIVASGSNALCVCTEPELPTNCGDCPIVENKCGCVDAKSPGIVPASTAISLDDPKYFEKIQWTISYDPKEKMWLSFHDWHPSLMIPSLSHFFTIDGKTFWKHNERFDSFTNYYNPGDADPTKDYGWEVEYNIVTPNAVTTLRSIEYYMEAYKYYNNGKDMFHVLDENFDRAIIYNSEQVSPLLSLKIKDKNNPNQQLVYPVVGPINTVILASKEENKYRFNTFYDITKDRQEFATSAATIPGFMAPGSGVGVPMFVTLPDGYHKTINPAYVDVLKKPLEHKKFRHFGNKIVLRKTASGDKKMLLKLVNSKILNSSR